MKGFSLIELLVVVAIIAILAAISLPMYLQYSVRAQVEQAIPLLSSMTTQLQKTYESSGSFPTAPTFPGNASPFTTGANCSGGPGTGWIAVSIPGFSNAAALYYQISSDGKGAIVGVQFANLNIPGFSYALGGGTYNSLFFATRDINGSMVSTCGGNNTTNNIPSSYIPQVCSCNLMGNCRTTGFLNTGVCS